MVLWTGKMLLEGVIYYTYYELVFYTDTLALHGRIDPA